MNKSLHYTRVIARLADLSSHSLSAARSRLLRSYSLILFTVLYLPPILVYTISDGNKNLHFFLPSAFERMGAKRAFFDCDPHGFECLHG